MNIKVVMDKKTGYYFIRSTSILDHSFHKALSPDKVTSNFKSMNEHHENILSILYNRGISSSSIADIMTDVVDDGEFLGKNIINYTNKMQKAKELLEGIDPDFSVAEKTLATLRS